MLGCVAGSNCSSQVICGQNYFKKLYFKLFSTYGTDPYVVFNIIYLLVFYFIDSRRQICYSRSQMHLPNQARNIKFNTRFEYFRFLDNNSCSSMKSRIMSNGIYKLTLLYRTHNITDDKVMHVTSFAIWSLLNCYLINEIKCKIKLYDIIL